MEQASTQHHDAEPVLTLSPKSHDVHFSRGMKLVLAVWLVFAFTLAGVLEIANGSWEAAPAAPVLFGAIYLALRYRRRDYLANGWIKVHPDSVVARWFYGRLKVIPFTSIACVVVVREYLTNGRRHGPFRCVLLSRRHRRLLVLPPSFYDASDLSAFNTSLARLDLTVQHFDSVSDKELAKTRPRKRPVGQPTSRHAGAADRSSHLAWRCWHRGARRQSLTRESAAVGALGSVRPCRDDCALEPSIWARSVADARRTY
jgi:hypothetical protein